MKCHMMSGKISKQSFDKENFSRDFYVTVVCSNDCFNMIDYLLARLCFHIDTSDTESRRTSTLDQVNQAKNSIHSDHTQLRQYISVAENRQHQTSFHTIELIEDSKKLIKEWICNV